MISFVRGTVAAVDGDAVVVDTGGLGYDIQVPERSAADLQPGAEVVLHTVLIPRDDALLLFGFTDVAQRQIFNLLRGISGVGPRTALAALSGLGAAGIVAAARKEDAAAFRSISGIGPKTAKLIAVQLADKLDGLAPIAPEPMPDSTALGTVVQALVGLGWNEREARDAAESAVGDGVPVQQALRTALQRLGTRR
ncbi:MAG: Holliday junction branch migration protein RuvA [Pseudoclavibacter sp.]